MNKITEKLAFGFIHLLFGGLVTGIGAFLGFYVGLIIYRRVWAFTHSLSTEYDYLTVVGAIIGSIIFLYIYVKRFIIDKTKLWQL